MTIPIDRDELRVGALRDGVVWSAFSPFDKIVAHLLVVRGDLESLVRVAFNAMGESEDCFEVMEPICVAALGPRVECVLCHNCDNFPGTACWECGAVDGVEEKP